MKKIILTLVLAAATVINVCAMSKYRASREARFLTDKMACQSAAHHCLQRPLLLQHHRI